MKQTDIHAVDMVRKIRDRHAKALAGKSEAEIIAFYRAAGEAAMRGTTPSAPRRTAPARKSPRSAKLNPRKHRIPGTSRGARG